MKELVSVIIPVFNGEKYLCEAIKSVLNQSYKEIELLIIDDGSTDNTRNIAVQFSNTTDVVKYYYKENSGVSDTRNKGIDLAKGKWCMFLDADDILAPYAIEDLMYENAELVDWIAGDYTREMNQFSKMSSIKTLDPVEIQHLILNSVGWKHITDYLPFLFDDIILMTVWGKLFCTDLIKENKVQFNSNIQVCEDVVFNLDYLNYCRHVVCKSGKIYYYRTYENSASLHINERRFDSLMALVNDIYFKYMNYDGGKFKNDVKVYITKMLIGWFIKFVENGSDNLLKEKFIPFIAEPQIRQLFLASNFLILSWGKKQRFQYTIIAFLWKASLYKLSKTFVELSLKITI